MKTFREKRLIKDECYGHSVLLLESISEVKNKCCLQAFLDKFFECNSIECSAIEKYDNTNVNSLFKELVEIVDWSDDE